jgi:UDP-glucose 4-epimerase
MVSAAAATEENKCDERRENGEREVTTLGVGQGKSLAEVINSYSQAAQELFTTNLEARK